MPGLQDVKKIFMSAVEAVKPHILIQNKLKYVNNQLMIDDEVLDLNGNCHVVGFGKAVLPMALGLESVLSRHIRHGILSTPKGSVANFDLSEDFLAKYKVFEGAKNNLPDADSTSATREIEKYAESLTEEDILFVLISGGGSALLADPVSGISLEDKQKAVKLLSDSGATIQELNCLRKKLSAVKGGRFAQLSYPATTVSLILSDVISDPLDVIASGPTVENSDSEGRALDIVKKYELQKQLSANVLQRLSRSTRVDEQNFHHVINKIIGNNQSALGAAQEYAQELGYLSLILTDRIQGEASIVGQSFAELAQVVSSMMQKPGSHENMEEMSLLFERLNLPPSSTCTLEKLIRNCSKSKKSLCLISGGETTVTVRGPGLGGRNQEMSLSFSIHSRKWRQSRDLEVVFLSAGTDGIDGPTEATGAIGASSVMEESNNQQLDPESYLNRNDSCSFYRKLSDGMYHLVIGHTGTNVMDVQIMCFAWTNGSEVKNLS